MLDLRDRAGLLRAHCATAHARLPVRGPQLALQAVVTLDVALRSLPGPPFGWPAVAGPLVLAGVTAVVLGTRLHDRPRWWWVALALLDLLGIGLAGLGDGPSVVITTAALPAYFLGRHFHRAGSVLATAGALVLVVLPGMVLRGMSATEVSWCATTMLLVVAAAVTASTTVRQLRAEEGVARAIVESVPVGLMLVTGDGRYEAVNDRQVELVLLAHPGGRGMHGAVDDDDGLVFAADGVSRLAPEQRPSVRAARGERFDDVVVWVGDDTATRRALSVSARPILDPDGRFTCAAVSCQDVTTYLRAQAVKDAFVANVSHELRTPLASIRGYVELLADGPPLPGRAAAHLAAVERNAERLALLVDDLVLSAQVEQGLLVLDRRPCDLGVLARERLELAAAPARQAGVELVLEVSGPVEVEVDVDRFTVVVDNLLANAVKFARGGQVRLLVRGEPEWVYVSVEDDGPGIASEDLAHVFERFFRAESARAAERPGVGLGLSIVRDVVEAHGGAARVWSAAGHGTVAEVKVPRPGVTPAQRRRSRTQPGPVSTW